MPDPTVVVARLDNKELNESIKQMVADFENGLNRMKQSADTAVADLQKTLKKLSDTKVDSSGSADGGSSRRKKSNDEETQSIKSKTAATKEFTATLDQQAQAMQKAMQPKSARDSYYTFAKHYSDQAKALEPLIQSFEQNLSTLIQNRINEINRTITASKLKIQELNQELNRGYASGNQTAIQQTQAAIDKENRFIREQQELLKNVGQEFVAQKMYLTGLVAEHKHLSNYMKDETVEKTQTVKVTQEQVSKEKILTNELQRQAKAIRETKDWKEKGRVIVGDTVYYDPERANMSKRDKAKLLSLEEQILQAQEKQAEAERKLAKEAQSVADSKQQQQRALGTFTPTNTDDQSKRLSEQNEKLIQHQQEIHKTTAAYQTMEQAIAGALKIEQQEIHSYDVRTASARQLNAMLKQQQEAYSRLSFSQRNQRGGTELANSIQRISRRLQELKAFESRPISLKVALDIPVKNLDDMAYKIRQLQSYKMGINLNAPQAANEIKHVDDAINRLKKDMDKYMTTGREVNSMNNALARSFNYMKNRLAFYFTVGASTAFVKNLINIRGQYELLERSIGILFDSMQTGSKIFSELNAMAIKSPFTTMELGAAAKQLSAYNIAAKDVVDTTRRLADMAAAVGIPIERLTYALGQIKSYGYLNSRDARMFANAGIPLIQNLADMYTRLEGRMVSIGDVYDRIKHKQVSFEDTLKVVNEMTDEGGRFFNFQEKAADTLVVRLANLTLAWNNMLNELGKDNTGLISNTLGGLKTIFEHWRDIDAAIWGVVKVVGILKGAQLIWLTFVKRTSVELVLANTLGQTLGYKILGIGLAMKSLAANPVTWIAAAVVSAGYLYQKWRDLEAANDAFNKSVSDGAQENINSIDKFFDKYRKEIDSIGSANSTDQEKMWERVRDEIEKTTKNAQQYIDILEKIPNVAERVGKASGYLEHQQVLQQEVKRMADHELFNMGGGFANDSLAKDLRDYEKTMNSVLKKYDSLEAAQKDLNDSMMAWSSGQYAVKYYNEAVKEAEDELNNFTASLDKADIARIKGNGSYEEQLANIRSFAQLVRDNFLATEEGQKISTEGQALLNKEIDNWIAAQGVANNLINKQRAEVEKNRSAWEVFFNQLNADEKRAVDYLINTGKITTDEFKKIWNDAADRMKESSKTAYEQIQTHIANLRNTAPIVIDVVYRETKESKDEAQKDFERRFTTPDHVKDRSAEEYAAEQKRLNTIYGRFNKKTEEDMVEWEERLGKEYQDNEKKLASYNKMLDGYNKLSDEEKKKREAQITTLKQEKDSLQATQDALKEIRAWENFDFDQFKKGKKGGSKKDYLGEAFAKIVEVTENMQKRFKEYKKAGVDANTALEKSTNEYGKTLESVNKTLQKYGIKDTKTGSDLAKMELRDLRSYYEYMLTIASGVGNTKGIETLEKAIANLNVEITKTDYKKVVDGLNNELGKIKEEYELAIDLDANPELGNVFADLMGISEGQLQDLPRNFDSVLKKMQAKIDTILGSEKKFDLAANLNKKVFEQWIDANGMMLDSDKAKALKAYVDAANKIRQDETKKQIDEWNKLLEKYAEYEYKRKTIMETAERERKIAIQKGASQEIINAINNRERQDLAKLDFEEFQKTPEWIVATGDLANLSKSAIGLLIRQIEEYKRTARDLSPKQIKQLNSALSKLYKEQKKNNPFKAISNMLQEARDGMATFDEDIKKVQKEIDDLTKKKKENIVEGIADEETDNKLKEAIKRLNELKKEREEVGDIDASQWVAAINETVSAVKSAVSVVDDFVNALAGVKESDVGKVFGVIEKAGSAAAAGAQVGGGWGAVIGGLLGAVSGLFDVFGEEGNNKITESVKESELAVRRLEVAYVDLQHAIDRAYGSNVAGAKRVLASAKELELYELQRQHRLEQSRDDKHKDEERIHELEKQILELKYEIEDTVREIVDDLLGTDAGSFAENLVSSMIDAFKKGEDYMKVFEDSFESMVDNMIMKSIVGRVVASYIDGIWDSMDTRINSRAKAEADALAAAQAENTRRRNLDLIDVVREISGGTDSYDDAKARLNKAYMDKEAGRYNELWDLIEEYYKVGQDAEDAARAAYNAVSQIDDTDIDFLIEELGAVMPELGERLKEILGKYYTFGEDSEKNLSSLQQGIQGITEDTAGALEAITNGISQQCYLQSDILIQIRDTIMSFDMDVQLGVFSQMLLQLQNNYIVMQSMQSMMENWTVPSGQGIRVELMS